MSTPDSPPPITEKRVAQINVDQRLSLVLVDHYFIWYIRVLLLKGLLPVDLLAL